MTKTGKLRLILAIPFVLLMVGLISIALLASHALNLEMVRSRIERQISLHLGGQVSYRQAQLRWLPRPHTVISEGIVTVPSKFQGSVSRIELFPELLPLLKGQLRLSRVGLRNPVMKIESPPLASHANPTDWLAILSAATGDRINALLSASTVRDSRPEVLISGGSLLLTTKERINFAIREIQALLSLKAPTLDYELSCTSEMWRKMSVQGSVNPGDLHGRGQIRIDGLQVRQIAARHFADSSWKVGQAELNLDIDLTTAGRRDIDLDVRGDIPLLAIQHMNRALTLRGNRFKLVGNITATARTFSLTELQIQEPRFTGGGQFTQSRTSPQMALQLSADRLDIGALRNFFLAHLKTHVGLSKTFEIIKDGEMVSTRFSSRGNDVKELFSLGRLEIDARLVDALIWAPGLNREVRQVNGKTHLQHGRLEGSQLSARLENSKGLNGELSIDLARPKEMFHLGIDVQADLAQLPPILKQFVPHVAFKRELDTIVDFQGTAEGRLILNRVVGIMKPRVEVSNFKLSGNYPRLPYPVAIQSGQFNYRDAVIDVRNLAGTMRGSIFSKLSAHLNLRDEPQIKILSGNGRIDLGQVHPWVSKFQSRDSVLSQFESLTGFLNVSALRLQGDIRNPSGWHYRMLSTIEKVQAAWEDLPFQIDVSGGGVEMVPHKLSLTDLETGFLDAGLRVNGAIEGPVGQPQQIDLILQGDVGARALAYLQTSVRLPAALALRPPLSAVEGNLNWVKPDAWAFRIKAKMAQNLKATAEIFYNSNELNIDKLLFQDTESLSLWTIRIGAGSADFSFTGNLTASTLEKLLQKNPYEKGWVRGDFRAHIVKNRPLLSSAHGKLQGGELKLLLSRFLPIQSQESGKRTPTLELASITLDAAQHSLTINSADLMWDQTPLMLGGRIEFAPDRFDFDLDLLTTQLNWDDFVAAIKGRQSVDRLLGELPFKGTLRFRAEKFKYDRFTLQPLQVNLELTPDQLKVAFIEADLCGILTPGKLAVTTQSRQLSLLPQVRSGELNTTISCLWHKAGFMTGAFNLAGNLSAAFKDRPSTQDFSGTLNVSAKNGRIYRFDLLAKLFAVLNVTEIFVGKMPDWIGEGFAYDSITARGELHEGRLVVTQAIVDGRSMKLVCEGEFDLINRNLDFTVLVAPFKTIDLIVQNLPLVNQILDGSLVTIPVKFSGSIGDPTITPLEPSAVGSTILAIMKRTFQIPIELIQPLMPVTGVSNKTGTSDPDKSPSER